MGPSAEAALAVIAAGGGEEPGGMAMGGPVFAEGLERARRQRDEAVLGALAAMDVDHHAGGVDVADLEVEALGEAEAQRIDGPEVGAVVGCTDGGDESSDLVSGEDVGEAFLPRDAEALEGGPVSGGGVRIEELDAAVSDAEGSGGEVAVVLEVEEILAELLLGEAVGRGAEVLGEHADGTEVGVLGAGARPASWRSWDMRRRSAEVMSWSSGQG